MKTIKIRFIKRGKILSDYLIQKKTWLGWKHIGYWQGTCTGDSIWYLYRNDNTEELLKEVLEYYYLTDKKFVKVIEYPMIKEY